VSANYSFPVLLARRVLLTGTASEFQRMAISLIENGYDCPDLHELAWEALSTRFEAQQLFDSAAAQIGLELPTARQAVETLLRYHALRIVAGECSPAEGLGLMMREVYWPEVSKHTSSVHVGDGFDMQDFIGSYYAYDDLFDGPNSVGYNGLYGDAAIVAFDEDVRSDCRRWLERHNEEGADTA